jgi:hypothetical protein
MTKKIRSMKCLRDVVNWLRYDVEWNDIASEDKSLEAQAVIEAAILEMDVKPASEVK